MITALRTEVCNRLEKITCKDYFENHIDQVDDDKTLLALPVGVPLVAQLQVWFSEAVGK